MYIELKIIKAINYLYRKCISIGMYSINNRDVKALRKLDKDSAKATRMREVAKKLKESAVLTEDKANLEYGEKSREVTSAYNLLQNLMDDSKLTLGDK